MRRCLIVFAKEPQQSKVKTRLKDCLSDQQRLNLYRAFLRDVLALTRDVRCEEKILAYATDGKSAPYLQRLAYGFRLYRQRGKDLGERMDNAFRFAERNKCAKIVIIGADAPTLRVRLIADAFELLDAHDIVVGPSIDGGYYLIGLKRPLSGLFRGIKWGGANVLSATLKKARALKKKVAKLEKWYDVDDGLSLKLLQNNLSKEKDRAVARWTRKFLKRGSL